MFRMITTCLLALIGCADLCAQTTTTPTCPTPGTGTNAFRFNRFHNFGRFGFGGFNPIIVPQVIPQVVAVPQVAAFGGINYGGMLPAFAATGGNCCASCNQQAVIPQQFAFGGYGGGFGFNAGLGTCNQFNGGFGFNRGLGFGSGILGNVVSPLLETFLGGGFGFGRGFHRFGFHRRR